VKRSTAVALVLSGAILGGCSRREEQTTASLKNPQVVTNDTYIEGRGYYHAPYHTWHPFPYNFYSPGLGYYRGGSYYAQPDLTIPRPTYPGKSMNATASAEANVNRGGFTRSSSSGGGWGWRSSSS
jgi:hypothetical protein